MTALYSLIILLALSLEFSTKVNTDNIIKKVSLALIMVGSLVHISGHENYLIEFGLLGYFAADFAIHLMRKNNRRKDDRVHG